MSENRAMDLQEIRGEIDRIDVDLVRLLVRRSQLALEARKHKKPDYASVAARDRVAEVIGRVRNHAVAMSGDPDLIQRIYEAIIRELTNIQLEELKDSGGATITS